MPGARLHVGDAVLDDGRADRDGHVEVSVEVEVADDAAVDAAPAGLVVLDEAERPRLGRAATGCRRGTSPRARRRPCCPAVSVPTTVDSRWVTWRVAADVHELDDVDGARLADPLEVVAAEVDEHDVLGALLGVGEQVLGERAGRPRASCHAAGTRRSGG